MTTRLFFLLTLFLTIVHLSAQADASSDRFRRDADDDSMSGNPGAVPRPKPPPETTLSLPSSPAVRPVPQILPDGAVHPLATAKQALAPPLIAAAIKGNMDAVQRLLAEQADPESQDASGYTALHWAAYYGHLPVIQALVERGASVDANANPLHWTPLMNAAMEGHLDIATYLIEHGADVSLTAIDGQTALDIAVSSQGATSPVAVVVGHYDLRSRENR